MEELKCEVIQVLLPSYVEGITSQESNRLIEQHLLSCEKCKDTVIMMKEDECPDEPKIKREIDFMKKIKRKHKVTNFICVITLVCVLGEPQHILRWDLMKKRLTIELNMKCM